MLEKGAEKAGGGAVRRRLAEGNAKKGVFAKGFSENGVKNGTRTEIFRQKNRDFEKKDIFSIRIS